MTEGWRVCEGYETMEASTLGNVRRIADGRMCGSPPRRYQYRAASVVVNGKPRAAEEVSGDD